MDAMKWLEKATRGATHSAAAAAAGFPASTLLRQVKRGRLSADMVVAIARAYNVPVLDALVACGYITQEEAQVKIGLDLEESLREATDEQLLRELLRRIDVDGRLAHPDLTSPADVEPLASVSPMPGYSTDETILPSAAYAADWQEVDSDLEAEQQAQEP